MSSFCFPLKTRLCLLGCKVWATQHDRQEEQKQKQNILGNELKKQKNCQNNLLVEGRIFRCLFSFYFSFFSFFFLEIVEIFSFSWPIYSISRYSNSEKSTKKPNTTNPSFCSKLLYALFFAFLNFTKTIC